MSRPVPYLPDETRHDIRNTRRGEYLFVPTELITQAFCFILASLARRYRVGIVAYAMMCTHIHVIVVDLGSEGEPSDVPRFRSVLRSTFAQFVKLYWQRDNGRIFCPDSVGSSIKILDFSSIEEAIAYVETNPMEAGMERTPAAMKGAVSLRKWLLSPITIERPDVYFQKRTWADSEQLQLVVPPIALEAGHTVQSFYEASNQAVEHAVRRIQRARKRKKLKSRPLHVLRRLTPDCGRGRSSADHSEALLSCNDPVRAAMEYARIRAFRAAHSRALHQLLEGNRDVEFPPGTYLAARVYGVNVKSRPPERPQSE